MNVSCFIYLLVLGYMLKAGYPGFHGLLFRKIPLTVTPKVRICTVNLTKNRRWQTMKSYVTKVPKVGQNFLGFWTNVINDLFNQRKVKTYLLKFDRCSYDVTKGNWIFFISFSYVTAAGTILFPNPFCFRSFILGQIFFWTSI